MPTIFRDPVDVTIDGKTFHFNDNALVDGATFNVDVLDGWDDTPEPRVEQSEFGYSDGVRMTNRFPLKEKYIEFGGWINAPDRATADRAKDRLSALLDTDKEILLSRSSTRTRAMVVRRVSSLETTQDAELAWRWVVRLAAPWPFKITPTAKTVTASGFTGRDMYRVYGTTAPYYRQYENTSPYYRIYLSDTSGSTSTGLPDSISIVNEGNAVAYPMIVVNGPLTAGSWELTNETTEETMTFGLDISTGSSLEINTLNRTATMSGQDVEYFVRGDMITLIPGINIVRLSLGEDNPNARVTLTMNDTWKR